MWRQWELNAIIGGETSEIYGMWKERCSAFVLTCLTLSLLSNYYTFIAELFRKKFAHFVWINFRPKYMFARTNNSQVWIPAWWLLYSDTLLSIPVLGSTSSYLRALGDQWLGDSQVEDYITKIPSEIEVALRYTLPTLVTLLTVFKLIILFKLLCTA